MKSLRNLTLVAAVCMMCGCISITSIKPYDHGYAVGTAIYAGYARIARNKDPKFTEMVEELWVKVNKIQSTKTLATDMLAVTEVFDRIINTDGLSDHERRLLREIKVMALTPVDGRLESWAAGHDDAVRFLEGLRSGVNAMVELDK